MSSNPAGNPEGASIPRGTAPLDAPILDAYAQPLYLESLRHVGAPVALPRSGGSLLERSFADGMDACGPYPLLTCSDWEGLAEDLEGLASRCVSVTAVVDPMAQVDEALLRKAFPDQVLAFKTHFVLDLEPPLTESLSGHHRRKWKRGVKRVRVEWADAPAVSSEDSGDDSLESWASDWHRLYAGLIERHGIRGAAAFSPESLTQQLNVPGARVQRALVEDRVVSMVVWYPCGIGMRYHLAATDPEGYDASATYALFGAAFERFRAEGLAWAHLGAGAGVQANVESGLTMFKKGWATRGLTAYLCGRVLQPERYSQWCRDSKVAPDETFFPAYRAPQPDQLSDG